jgi:hypothetical protein
LTWKFAKLPGKTGSLVLEVWVYFKNCWKFEKILFKTPVAISQTSSGVHTYGCVRGAPERDFAAFSYLYLDFASLRLCVFAVLLLLLLSVVTLTCVLLLPLSVAWQAAGRERSCQTGPSTWVVWT